MEFDDYSKLAVFKAVIYDTEMHREITEYGICDGRTWCDAMAELEHYYGDELVNVFIELRDIGPVLITEDQFNGLVPKD